MDVLDVCGRFRLSVFPGRRRRHFVFRLLVRRRRWLLLLLLLLLVLHGGYLGGHQRFDGADELGEGVGVGVDQGGQGVVFRVS